MFSDLTFTNITNIDTKFKHSQICKSLCKKFLDPIVISVLGIVFSSFRDIFGRAILGPLRVKQPSINWEFGSEGGGEDLLNTLYVF